MSKIELTSKEAKEYPTVREMLEYIKEADIPMDAIVTCEQLSDFYLEEKPNLESWDYFEIPEDEHDSAIKLIPAHNKFGSAFKKKLFVIWMHY